MNDARNEEHEQEEGRHPLDDRHIELLGRRLRARALHAGNGIWGPPVTAEQLEQAEQRLGFTLPPLLRHLYTTVAKCAEYFHPGQIFYGIADDRNPRPAGPGSIETARGDGERLDEATVAALVAHPGAYVACHGIPVGFVDLCALGCTVDIWLDGPTGRLFASDNVLDEDGNETIGFSYWAPSVEDWLEQMLADAPFDGDGSRQPHFPLARLTGGSGAHRGESGTTSGIADSGSHTDSHPDVDVLAPAIPATRAPNRREGAQDAQGVQEQRSEPGHDQANNRALPEPVRRFLEQQRRAHEARNRRVEQEAQRIRLVRQEVVRLLDEVSAIQETMEAEIVEAQAVQEIRWGDLPLQSLADAEAHLYEMERLLTSGMLTYRPHHPTSRG